MYEQRQLLPVCDKQVLKVDGDTLNGGLVFDVSSNALFAYADSPVGAALQRKPIIQQQQQDQSQTKLNASGFAFDIEPPTYGSGKRRIRDEEKVPCPHCKRVFKRAGYLRMHLVSHSDTGREQRCEICGKGFAQKGHLMLHMRSHRAGLKNSVRRNSCSSTGSSGYESTSPNEELKNLRARHPRTPASIHQQQQQQHQQILEQQQPSWILRDAFAWKSGQQITQQTTQQPTQQLLVPQEAPSTAWQPIQQSLALPQMPAWQPIQQQQIAEEVPTWQTVQQTMALSKTPTWQALQQSPVVPQEVPVQQQSELDPVLTQLFDLTSTEEQRNVEIQYTWTNSETVQINVPDQVPVGPQQVVTAVPVPEEDFINDLLDLFDTDTATQPEVIETSKVDESQELYCSIDDILVNYLGFLP